MDADDGVGWTGSRRLSIPSDPSVFICVHLRSSAVPIVGLLPSRPFALPCKLPGSLAASGGFFLVEGIAAVEAEGDAGGLLAGAVGGGVGRQVTGRGDEDMVGAGGTAEGLVLSDGCLEHL